MNADGFGFGAGATEGIFHALREGGFISSVSVNANFPEAERVRDLVNEFPHLSIGVHLNPMVGRPCLPASQVRSLVDRDGNFLHHGFLGKLRSRKIDVDELDAEFDAQIAAVRTLAGDRVTHLDSQANSHLEYLDLFLTLARKWNLRCMRNNASLICLEADAPEASRRLAYLRRPHTWIAHRFRQHQMRKARAAGMQMADMLITVGYAGVGNKTRAENWERVLRNLPNGTYEIYCHPAYPSDTLQRWSYYREERARELEILRQPRWRDLAGSLGVDIISFYALNSHATH